MADQIREEVLVDVRLQKDDTEKSLTTVTQKILDLQNKNKDLVKSNIELAKSGKENSAEYVENTKQIEINKQKISESSSIRKGLIQTLVAEDNSIKALQIRNAELIKQRNLIDTSTEEGRAAIQELNAEIDRNNNVIKDNVSGMEKQRMNIGNYKSALDALVPGFGGFIDGLQGAKAAGLAFIATPIGAVIGAIGLALGALIAYFKGSEEGQNRLNRIMNIGGAIMEKLMDVVESLGGALFDAAENPKKAFEDLITFIKDNLINRFTAIGTIIEGIANMDFKQVINGTLQLTTGVKDVIGKMQSFGEEVANQANDAMDRAERFSRLQESINKQERDLIVQRAQTARDVAEKIIEGQALEGQARVDKVNEAIALERKLLEAERAFAATKLKEAKMIVEDDPTIENKKAYVEAVAAQLKAEENFFTGIKRLDAQRLAAAEEARNMRIQILEDDLKMQHEQYLEEKAIRDQKEADDAAIEGRFLDRLKRETQARKDAAKEQSEDIKKESKIIVATKEAEQLAIAEMLGRASTLFRENTIAHKILASAEATMNTYIGASKALAEYGFPLGTIFAAIMVAQGLAQVAKINAIEFAKGGRVPGFAAGGLSGTRIMDHHGIPVVRSNGDNRLATVKVGEVILNDEQQSVLGLTPSVLRSAGVPGYADGGLVGSSATRAIAREVNRTIDVQELASIVNSVKTVLVLQDFEAAEAAKNSPISRSEVI